MDVTVLRSKRRTICVEVRADGSVVVRAPVRMAARDVQRFVESKARWIEAHVAAARERAAAAPPPLTGAEIAAMKEEAKRIVPQRVAHFAPLVGVEYGRITIRCQATRWGSCSAKGNLSFNCLLVRFPPEVLDYVVVHELCHRKQMNHSPAFWAEVERVLPDFRARRTFLAGVRCPL